MGQVGIRVESLRSRRKPESIARLKQAARKLFVERGYDATRPPGYCARSGAWVTALSICIMPTSAPAFSVLPWRMRAASWIAHLRERRRGATLKQSASPSLLEAMYDYADRHPGLLRAALTDARVIDAEGEELRPLLTQWGEEWAKVIGEAVAEGSAR